MYATLETKTHNIAPAVAGPPQMNASFWGNITKMLGNIIVSLQYLQPNQQQPGSTKTFHKVIIKNYNYHALADLMGYYNVFNTSDIP